MRRASGRLGSLLRREDVGGYLLLAGALLALVWANTPWAPAYARLAATSVGPEALHLRLTLATWAADGLLAIFFFVAGLELKREFVVGDLRSPARAVLPVAAAVGGMIVPAVLSTAVALASPGAPLAGWAIPTATDIAFAVSVLALVGRHLPPALRTFLLTLAVVDDLLAITIIAVFYTRGVSFLPLVAAGVPLGLFALLAARGVRAWWLLPLALATWVLVHTSGVHATVAGVLLGFSVPVVARDGRPGPAERFERWWRPVSAGVAVPVFAFFSAGVGVVGGGLVAALGSPVTLGIVVGLVVGKTVGVLGSTWLAVRLTRARLDPALAWPDVLGLAMLAGIGFTVSLLIGELAFGAGTPQDDHVKIGVLGGSLLAAAAAVTVLRVRDRVHRRRHEDRLPR